MTRQNFSNVIVFDGGNEFEGTLYFQVFEASVTEVVMNIMKYDAMALGTNEFDLGDAYLLGFLSNVKFPIICANLDTSVRNPFSLFVFFFVYLS